MYSFKGCIEYCGEVSAGSRHTNRLYSSGRQSYIHSRCVYACCVVDPCLDSCGITQCAGSWCCIQSSEAWTRTVRYNGNSCAVLSRCADVVVVSCAVCDV